jgi:hypothetical protein
LIDGGERWRAAVAAAAGLGAAGAKKLSASTSEGIDALQQAAMCGHNGIPIAQESGMLALLIHQSS